MNLVPSMHLRLPHNVNMLQDRDMQIFFAYILYIFFNYRVHLESTGPNRH